MSTESDLYKIYQRAITQWEINNLWPKCYLCYIFSLSVNLTKIFSVVARIQCSKRKSYKIKDGWIHRQTDRQTNKQTRWLLYSLQNIIFCWYKINTGKRKSVGHQYFLLLYHKVSQKHNWVYMVNPFPHNDTILTPLGDKPIENTVGKGEIARNKRFFLFPQCFLPVWITFCYFRQVWYCRLQSLSIWKSLKFVVW